MTICVDASVVVSWLLPEEQSENALRLKERWEERSDSMIAPPLLRIEVASVLRQSVYRQRLTSGEGEAALDALLQLPIALHRDDLTQRAWQVAQILNAPRLYDMYYLALADLSDCELWTVDRRLVNLAGNRFPRVRWVGDAEAES
jgi:predicted nucleic acid-binding protein